MTIRYLLRSNNVKDAIALFNELAELDGARQPCGQHRYQRYAPRGQKESKAKEHHQGPKCIAGIFGNKSWQSDCLRTHP